MPSRRVAGVVAGILMLIPACWAGLTALSLARASWPVAAARGEPLVEAIVGERDLGAALVKATDLARLDFHYPKGLAEEDRAAAARDGWSAPALLTAHGHLGEAARRAPTDAEIRFHLSGIAYRMGRTEEADREARAALRLAPLHKDIRGRVGRYFQSRYAQTRDEAHLRTAVAALRGREEDLTRVVLGDPLLTLGQIRTAFAAARTPVDRQLHYLGESGRWDWAIAIARETDLEKGPPPSREAGVRARLGRFLLSIDRPEAAFVQILEAHRLVPDAVTDGLALGRAFIASGREEEGFRLLDRLLDDDVEAGVIASALDADEVDAARRASFWGAVVTEGRGGDRARLARAGALLDLRRLDEAHRILMRLAESREVGAEACYSLARAHREFGDARIALKYAREAVTLAPRNREYRRFLKALSRREGK